MANGPNLPPINSNQRIVDDKGRPLSAFVLLINQLIKTVVNSIVGLTPIVPDPTGTYGDADDTPVVTVDQYGRVVAIDTVPTSGSGGGGGPPAWLVVGVGTGVAQNLTLPTSGLALEAVMVFVNGLRWETTEYTIAGTTITLTTNSAGDSIQVVGPLGGGAPFNIDGVGTGAPQNFTLPSAGIPKAAVLVFVNGLRWETTEYTIAGTTLTLTTNSAGDTVQIVGPLGSVSSGGGGAQEYVGVSDFYPMVDGSDASAGFFVGCGIFITEDTPITAVCSWVTLAGAGLSVYPAIYAYDPIVGLGALLGDGPNVVGIVQGLNVIPLSSPIMVSAGTYIWVGWVNDPATVIKVAHTNPQKPSCYFSHTGVPPNPAPTSTLDAPGSDSWQNFFIKTS